MGKIASKTGLEDAIAKYVTPGADVAIGGLHFHNTPMAFVREIIRQRIRIGRLIPPVDASINADQLIGAGLVEELHAPYVGFEAFGMAGRFRAAAESGRLKVRESDELGYVLGLVAAASGLPFAPMPEGIFPTQDHPPTVPSVNTEDYRVVTDPFTGTEHVAARAIRPDVSLIHCQFVDRRGNGGFLGSSFLDIEMAKAGRTCVILAEREVDELPAECRDHLPGFLVDAYVIQDMGAHPGSSHGLYRYDAGRIADYAEASRSDEGFSRYVTEVIGESEQAYAAAVDLDAARQKLSETETA